MTLIMDAIETLWAMFIISMIALIAIVLLIIKGVNYLIGDE